MTEIQHLRNAPIVEAMIDVRVEAREDFHGESFLLVQEALRAEYPRVEARRGVTLQLAFGGPETKQAVHEHGVDGVFFRSEDEKSVAQFRIDGFTFNRLAPYTSWGEIQPRALDLMRVYLDIAKPRSILRVATRYINRLRLPSEHLSEYLTSPPRSVPGTTSSASSFMEVTLATEADGSIVSYTQALEVAGTQGEPSVVIIDIDAFKAEPFEPRTEDVQGRLASLHELKNRVFFGAITESAMRFFL